MSCDWGQEIKIRFLPTLLYVMPILLCVVIASTFIANKSALAAICLPLYSVFMPWYAFLIRHTSVLSLLVNAFIWEAQFSLTNCTVFRIANNDRNAAKSMKEREYQLCLFFPQTIVLGNPSPVTIGHGSMGEHMELLLPMA